MISDSVVIKFADFAPITTLIRCLISSVECYVIKKVLLVRAAGEGVRLLFCRSQHLLKQQASLSPGLGEFTHAVYFVVGLPVLL